LLAVFKEYSRSIHRPESGLMQYFDKHIPHMKPITPQPRGKAALSRPINRWVSLFILVCGLSGCATQPLNTSIAELASHKLWIEQSKQLRNQQHWSLQGRIGVRLPGKAFSASIRWRQNKDRVDILLTGPLGQGSVRIIGDDQEIEFFEAKNGNITKGNPELLLRQHLGYALPLNQLSQWSLGLVGGDSRNSLTRQSEPIMDLLYDPQGFPSSFRTEFWRIQYHHWKTVPKQQNNLSYTLPHKIIFQSDAVKITLAIKHWKIPSQNNG